MLWLVTSQISVTCLYWNFTTFYATVTYLWWPIYCNENRTCRRYFFWLRTYIKTFHVLLSELSVNRGWNSALVLLFFAQILWVWYSCAWDIFFWIVGRISPRILSKWKSGVGVRQQWMVQNFQIRMEFTSFSLMKTLTNNAASNYTVDNFKVKKLFWFLKNPCFFLISL